MYTHGQACQTKLSRTSKHRHSGFGLIELLVTLSIVALLATAESAFFGQAMQMARESRVQQELLADLRLAQSEALRRGRQITIERADCDQINDTVYQKDWSCGWRVFVNQDNEGQYTASEDTLIKASSPKFPPPVRAAKTTVRFSPVGSTTDIQTFLIGSAGTFVTVSWLRIRT